MIAGLLWSLWTCLPLASLSACAQAASEQGAKVNTSVIHLKYTSANEISPTFSGLVDDPNGVLQIVPDERTNSLVIRGEDAQIRAIRALLDELDRKSDGSEEGSLVRIVPVFHYPIVELPKMLNGLCDDVERIGLDPRNRSLIVRGGQHGVECIERVVQQLDTSRGVLDISIYFLRAMTEARQRDPSTPPMPEVLRPVDAVLKESGYVRVELLAPMRINVEEGARFEQRCTLDVSQTFSVDFDVEGQISLDANTDVFRGELKGVVSGMQRIPNNLAGTATRSLFSLNTSIAGALDQCVVLAAGPGSTPDGDAIAMVLKVRRQAVNAAVKAK